MGRDATSWTAQASSAARECRRPRRRRRYHGIHIADGRRRGRPTRSINTADTGPAFLARDSARTDKKYNAAGHARTPPGLTRRRRDMIRPRAAIDDFRAISPPPSRFMNGQASAANSRAMSASPTSRAGALMLAMADTSRRVDGVDFRADRLLAARWSRRRRQTTTSHRRCSRRHIADARQVDA